MKRLFLLFLLLLFASNAHALTNGGFEDGSLGWTTDGNVFFSPFPVPGMPTEGTYHAQLNNGFPGGGEVLGGPSGAEIAAALGIAGFGGYDVYEGSYIYQTISYTAGSAISFDWNFLTNEGLESSYNDFALAALGGETVVLADTFSALIDSTIGGFAYMTGVQSFSDVPPLATGDYLLAFAILDVGDAQVSSQLLIDNIQVASASVPEPATMFLIGAGLIGIAGFRKRIIK